MSKQSQENLSSLLNDRAVARIVGVSASTVRRWRFEVEQGPRFIRVGKSAVRYRPEDVNHWIESLPTGGGTAEAIRQ